MITKWILSSCLVFLKEYLMGIKREIRVFCLSGAYWCEWPVLWPWWCSGPCCHQGLCLSLGFNCSNGLGSFSRFVLLPETKWRPVTQLTMKSKEITFAVILTTADTQLRRDMEGFCENAYPNPSLSPHPCNGGAEQWLSMLMDSGGTVGQKDSIVFKGQATDSLTMLKWVYT